jgi:hypothetical protein
VNFIEVVRIFGLGEANKNRLSGPAPLFQQSNKAGYRLHLPGGPDSNKRLAACKLAVNALKFIRLLAKPADVGPHERATGAARQVISIVDIPIRDSRLSAFVRTPALEQLAMNMDQVFRSRGFMQSIDVLSTQENAAGCAAVSELSQSEMRRVWLRIPRGSATMRVILPDQLRVTLPGLNVRQLIMAVPAPVRTLKDRNPALRADAGAGEDEDAASLQDYNSNESSISKTKAYRGFTRMNADKNYQIVYLATQFSNLI